MNNFEENFSVAKNLHKSGKLDEAIFTYKKLLKIDSSNDQVYYLLGTAFLQKKNYFESFLINVS